ncbi:fibronectin type III domain-containing protein [Streptomyces sp. SID5785]|uniref:fibronectin type III domain-containing protein n=1 Tax=Streptomyces sp. SID5785 TaxID=2690309 RepID=UPI001F15FB16|nr:fibronectin type III domain-containing protein [Streptomyces sp. SID5785]
MFTDDEAAGPALTEPVGVTAQAGSATSVHVMWNRPVSTTEVTQYEVYRGADRVRRLSATQHMIDVTGLRPRTRYVFTVRARGADGALGPASRRVTVTTPAAVAEDRAAPSRPSGLRGSVSGTGAVSLTWRAAHDDRGVVSYDVYQGTTKIHSVGGKETRAVVTGLRPGTAYAFSVRARDAADNTSSPSTTVRLTTARGKDGGTGADATAPGDFRARSRTSDGAHYIDLSWTPPHTGGEVPAYQVFVDGAQATTVMWGADTPDAAKYSFYIGKEAGERHRVKIRAQLPDGTWGAFSPERTVTTGG